MKTNKTNEERLLEQARFHRIKAGDVIRRAPVAALRQTALASAGYQMGTWVRDRIYELYIRRTRAGRWRTCGRTFRTRALAERAWRRLARPGPRALLHLAETAPVLAAALLPRLVLSKDFGKEVAR